MFLFNSTKKKSADTKTEKALVKVPDFVTEHVICDPKRIVLNYDLFASCKEVPIRLDKADTSSGWSTCKSFPAPTASSYLRALSAQSDEFRANPLARTIVEYNLGQNSFYIFPTLDIVYEPGFFLFMNKEIRQHMAEMIRKYKTLSK